MKTFISLVLLTLTLSSFVGAPDTLRFEFDTVSVSRCGSGGRGLRCTGSGRIYDGNTLIAAGDFDSGCIGGRMIFYTPVAQEPLYMDEKFFGKVTDATDLKELEAYFINLAAQKGFK